MKTNPGYESLAGILQRALDQAQDGKGAERHANNLPFEQQPMQTIARAHGVGFLTGQASKKAEESHGLPAGRDVAELLGAINYLAGAIIFLESQRVPSVANDNLVIPAIDYQCREIGEGDWRSCTHEEFIRYSAYPEMDTRQTKSGGTHG